MFRHGLGGAVGLPAHNGAHDTLVFGQRRILGDQMSSVFISSDACRWYESGPVRDVLIRNNAFLRPASPVIFVEPTDQVTDEADAVHRNIRVEDNEFRAGRRGRPERQGHRQGSRHRHHHPHHEQPARRYQWYAGHAQGRGGDRARRPSPTATAWTVIRDQAADRSDGALALTP
ncbi:hypothetical protein A6A29_30005 [Streptomyces sp. TSRI0281]|nr:hypothetical protein A6A29_30005 [Streptomyces sp. TSRI0281]